MLGASSSMTALQNSTQPTATSSPIMKGSSDQLPDGPDTHDHYNERCIYIFYDSMSKIKPEHLCELDHVISFYSTLQFCIELGAEDGNIPYPNEVSHAIFMDVHREFFANCTLLSYEFTDPPDPVLLALIFAPICIIPFLVTLVVVKSNTSKPQT
ncbi:receptor activity-modifying protein 2 isoform X2 [Pseudophryne corroboree]|uniref:receptor activity-modifying protein 2 isoform X2 n=1 Tax=Pseudophryne corroboree TaxID=495146 RepID=UPI003081C9EB